MTAFTDFISTIRENAMRKDWSDATVTPFIRTAESQLSRLMRVKEMLVIADGQVDNKRVKLPLDWRELDFVRVNGEKPLYYMSRDNFYSQVEGWKTSYTIVGNNLELGPDLPAPDGLAVEIYYYQAIPPFTADNTWMSTYYYDIYLQKCLSAAALYSEEVEKAGSLSALVDGWVAQANDEHLVSKISGSTLKRARTGRRLG